MLPHEDSSSHVKFEIQSLTHTGVQYPLKILDILKTQGVFLDSAFFLQMRKSGRWLFRLDYYYFLQLSTNTVWRKLWQGFFLQGQWGEKPFCKHRAAAAGLRSLRTLCHWLCISRCSPWLCLINVGRQGRKSEQEQVIYHSAEQRHLCARLSLQLIRVLFATQRGKTRVCGFGPMKPLP